MEHLDPTRPQTLLPRLYPILDAELLARRGIALDAAAIGLRDAGVRFLQYRDKTGRDAEIIERVRRVRSILPGAVLLLNDRVRLCNQAECDGVHVGQEDEDPEAARAVVGAHRIVGISTHDAAQVMAAERGTADYIAIGPVFATGSKRNPDPVVGLEGVRAARRLTRKPLVAIGGITRENARAVLDAGADSVAVLSALAPSMAGEEDGLGVCAMVRDFLAALR